jgi:hypothetical protein
VIIVETRKRTVIFLLVIFVIFSAGCTKGTEEKPGQEPEETKLEPLTLRILTIGDSSVNGRQYEFSKIVDMASAMTMEKYNTAFVMKFIPKYDDYVLRVSSGEPADIICNPPGTEKLIEEGLLADLTELLPNLYPESYMRIQDIQDEDNPVIYKGRIYLVPEVYRNYLTIKYCLTVNREFYNAAGRPPVDTLDDIIALAEFGVNNGYFNRGAKRCFLADVFDLIGVICQENGYIDLGHGFGLKDGKVVPLEETEVFEKLFETITRLDEKEAIVFKYNYTNFESTGIMSLLDSQYIGPNAIKDHTKFYNTMETLYINDTVPYTNKRIVGRYGITANDNTERSLIFLRWVATDPELNRLLCYGVEDVHYKFLDGRYYVPGDVFKIVNNFCKPTSPLIHILDPVGYDEFLESVETDEKQIIPGNSQRTNLFFLLG